MFDSSAYPSDSTREGVGMKVALFGSRGYLGTQLAYDFGHRGVEVVGFDMPECDVTDSGFWDDFEPSRYDAILFFAGKTGTEKSFEEADSFCAVNVMGLLGLLKRLSHLGENAPKIIFPSSRLVYKGAEVALREDSPKEARTVYAANKLACEYLLQAYRIRYGLQYVILRISVPWGNLISTDYSYGTIGFFMRQANVNKSITLYGDGSLRRTLTYIADICEIVFRVTQGVILSGEYNIGGNIYSLLDIAQKVSSKQSVSIRFVPWPEAALSIESGSTFFDSSKLDNVVSYGEYVDFDI